MKGGFEQPEIIPAEQQENQENLDALVVERKKNQEKQKRLDAFLEEMRPTIIDFVFDKLNESDYSYEKRQMIDKFTRKNSGISIIEINKHIEKIEEEIEQFKNDQLQLDSKAA